MQIITLPYAYALVDTPLDVCRIIVECAPGLSPEQDEWSTERAKRLLALWRMFENVSTEELCQLAGIEQKEQG